jgi:two-component system response regulator AlgR
MKVLIVDDEKPARDRLAQLLGDIDGYDAIGEAENGEDAVTLAGQLYPDIVLLDIRMQGMDGIEAAHHLNAMERPPAVVFTTAYDEYAIDAFEARAIGYVLKPVRAGRLESALEHAAKLAPDTLNEIAEASKLDARRKHLCVRTHGQLKLIPVPDVYYFRADQKYVAVHHAQGQDLIDDSLKALEKEFAGNFVRIHRGAVVAVDKIERLEKTTEGKHRVKLRDPIHEGDALVVSRRHLAEVRRRLKGG